uniref:Probable 40S ribosomal protein S14, mitochondrial (inferred by orthology to a C. elegans protein) n=1 Tax=Strongyloides venezuelensis TaxID=75913 RepID=A0A0K0F1Q9_STRVS
MLQNFTTVFKKLIYRSEVSLNNIAIGRYCTLPPKINESEDTEVDEKEIFELKRLPYNNETLEKCNLTKYPFYIEREWWKEGKRTTFWANWRQLRDVKRRQALAVCGPDRLRYKVLKENTILPQALRDEIAEKLHNMDKNSRPNLILNACMFTGRSRGKIKAYRVNRHIFRRLADHSQLSGVQRAHW